MDAQIAFWSVWALGLLPAIFIAGRRHDAWEQAGDNAELLGGVAPVFWPIWLAVAVFSPIFRVFGYVYEWVWSMGHASAQPSKRHGKPKHHQRDNPSES
jgi:hypothetical protein